MKITFNRPRKIFFSFAIFLCFSVSPIFSRPYYFSQEEIDQLYSAEEKSIREQIVYVARCDSLQEVLELTGKYSINYYFVNWIAQKEPPEYSWYKVVRMDDGSFYIYHYLKGKDKGESYHIPA